MTKDGVQRARRRRAKVNAKQKGHVDSFSLSTDDGQDEDPDPFEVKVDRTLELVHGITAENNRPMGGVVEEVQDRWRPLRQHLPESPNCPSPRHVRAVQAHLVVRGDRNAWVVEGVGGRNPIVVTSLSKQGLLAAFPKRLEGLREADEERLHGILDRGWKRLREGDSVPVPEHKRRLVIEDLRELTTNSLRSLCGLADDGKEAWSADVECPGRGVWKAGAALLALRGERKAWRLTGTQGQHGTIVVTTLNRDAVDEMFPYSHDEVFEAEEAALRNYLDRAGWKEWSP